MCGGGGAPPPPPLDPAQVALEQEQLKLLEEQSSQQSLFAPLQAEQAGYKAIYGIDPEITKRENEISSLRDQYNLNDKPQGSPEWQAAPQEAKDRIGQLRTELGKLGYGSDKRVVIGYEKTAAKAEQDQQLAELQSQQMATSKRANDLLNQYLDSLDSSDYKAYQAEQQKLQEQQTQIALAQGERQQKALKGELPISEGTTQRKVQEFQLLKENLARGGNAIIGDDPTSAYSLSSPGEQALKEFNTRYGAIEDAERRGELDSGTQAYLQSVGLSGNLGKNTLSSVSGLSGPGGYASTSPAVNRVSPVANNLSLIQGYSSAINPYLTQQQIEGQYSAGYLPNNGIGGAAGGALSGAAAGSMLGPWGALGGAVIGGAAGYFSTKR